MANIPDNPFDQQALDNLEQSVDLSRSLVDNANALNSIYRQAGSSLQSSFAQASKSLAKTLNELSTQTAKLSIDEFKRADAVKLQAKLQADITKLQQEQARIENNSLPQAQQQANLTNQLKNAAEARYRAAKATYGVDSAQADQARAILTRVTQSADKAKEKLRTEQDALDTSKQVIAAAQEENDRLGVYVERWNQANLKLGIFGKVLNGLKKIPILGDLMNADKALEAMKISALNNESAFKTMGKGISAAFSGIEKSTVILAVIGAVAKAIKFFVDAMFEADKQVTNLAKNLSISKEEAADVRESFIQMKDSLETQYKLTEDIIQAQLQLSSISSMSVMYSKSLIDNQIILTKELGLSEDEAAKLNSTLLMNTEEGEKSIDLVYDQIAAYGNQNKMLFNGSKILKEMSKVSGQILATFKGNTPALTNAVLRAEKLGLSLEKSRNMSESLLDFESSINAQMEAELLIGRSLNLDRARALALQGDYIGASEEILKNVKSYAEFADMNVLQQQALAKSLGMSADELADSLFKTEMQIKLGKDQVKQYKEKIRLARENGEIEKANALEAAMYRGDELQKAERSISAQDKFNLALDRMKEKFTDLVSGGTLDRLADLLTKIVDALESVDDREERARKTSAELMKSAKTEQEKAKIQELTETSQSGSPWWKRALASAVSPGAGMLMEAENEAAKVATTSLDKMKGSVSVKDFVIKTLPEDTVVAAGGTSLGNSKEMLAELKEQNRLLAALVAKNTAIQVDGQVIANVVARNVPTTPGNLLNPASRTYG